MGDVSSQVASFVSNIYDLHDRFFPVKKISINKIKPWITHDLKHCIKKKAKLHESYRKGRCTRLNYRNYCNILTSAIRIAKISYHQRKFANCKSDPKMLWQNLNTLKGKSGGRKKSLNKITVEQNIITDAKEIAIEFNNFFCNAPGLVKATLSESNESYLNRIPRTINTFQFTHITPNEIESVIKCFKNKTSNISEIPTWLLKKIRCLISEPLSILFNHCFLCGMYPNRFKIGRIVPIHKAGDKSIISNYRPITVLITFNKVFEKLIYSRMIDFIETHALLSNNQYGFRKRKNTTTAIMHLLKAILETFHEREVMIALFLDLSKAFDCVEHDILIAKLERYGFRGVFLDLLSTYLRNRMQYVDIEGVYSNQLAVKYGVPQGSVLGPLLFLIYINDLNFILPNINKILFADDTVLYKMGRDCNEIIQEMNNEVKILCDWLNANGLALNKSKTKMIVFTNQQVNNVATLKINETPIEQVDKYKYLGMIIDEKLTFDDHFTFLKGKISCLCGFLYSIRSLVMVDVLKSIYHGLVYPHLLLHIIV
jgi:hypothetical protein